MTAKEISLTLSYKSCTYQRARFTIEKVLHPNISIRVSSTFMITHVFS